MNLPSWSKLGILYAIWLVIHLPGISSFYYSLDDASFYLENPPLDLASNILKFFPQGRFFVPFYYYIFALLGIHPYISNVSTWLSGLFICLTALLLIECLEKCYKFERNKNYLLFLIAALYIIVSPLFTEVQYTHSAGFCITSIFLSTLAYLKFYQKQYRLSVILNLSALCLYQVGGMVFYVLLLLNLLADNLKSDLPALSIFKKFMVRLPLALSSLGIYALIFVISRFFFSNQNERRGLTSQIDLEFVSGKFTLMTKILERFLDSGKYSPPLVTGIVTSIFLISLASYYVLELARKERVNKEKFQRLCITTFCLLLIFPVANFPALIVKENWPSFRVSMVTAIACILLCLLPLAQLPVNASYRRIITLLLSVYLLLLSFYTFDIGTQKILVFQKDQETILKIRQLMQANGIERATIVASGVTNWNPYFIPNFVMSETDLLLHSSLDYWRPLRAWLSISQIGELGNLRSPSAINFSDITQQLDKERERFAQQYCPPGIAPMTPVLATDKIIVLCR